MRTPSRPGGRRPPPAPRFRPGRGRPGACLPGQDLVAPHEERLVAGQDIANQRLVGFRDPAEHVRIAETQAFCPQPHVIARLLDLEHDMESLIGLKGDDQSVAVDAPGGKRREHAHRWPAEGDHDPGQAAGQPLARAQEERDPVPPPVVDAQTQGNVGFRVRANGNAGLLPVSGHRPALDRPGSVLSEHHGPRLDGQDGAEDLDLLVTDEISRKDGRGLHGRQGQDLGQVVLDDIAQGPGLIVVTRPCLDTQGFGHRDLHGGHPVPVPEGFEGRVGEAEDEKVLDRLLAQIMVDPENLRLVEISVYEAVEGPGRIEVPAEGLLDDQPHPSFGGLQPGFADAPDRVGKERRGRGQIKHPVPVEPGSPFDVRRPGGQGRVVPGRRAEGQIIQPFRAPAGRLGADLSRLAQGLRSHPPQPVGPDVPGSHAKDPCPAEFLLAVQEVVQDGEKLALGQVPRSPDDDQQKRPGRPEVGVHSSFLIACPPNLLRRTARKRSANSRSSRDRNRS